MRFMQNRQTKLEKKEQREANTSESQRVPN